eukprot:1681230-Amphidinium_carterae.2
MTPSFRLAIATAWHHRSDSMAAAAALVAQVGASCGRLAALGPRKGFNESSPRFSQVNTTWTPSAGALLPQCLYTQLGTAYGRACRIILMARAC